jgi:serine/threonine protein kinase
MKEFEREISMLIKMKSHPNLIQFKGIAASKNEVFIIMEFCSGGNLYDLLHNEPKIFLSWKQKVKIITDIANGLKSLHSAEPPIVHRDMKSLK